MPGATKIHCLANLINLANSTVHLAPQDVRRAIDRALACDAKVRCRLRLECAWMASELADRLGRQHGISAR